MTGYTRADQVRDHNIHRITEALERIQKHLEQLMTKEKDLADWTIYDLIDDYMASTQAPSSSLKPPDFLLKEGIRNVVKALVSDLHREEALAYLEKKLEEKFGGDP